eukprot:Sspe_Gene.54798::Locus_30194_Transcript_2_4_Confidence_0.286_Length_1845::g.54798::m.54798
MIRRHLPVLAVVVLSVLVVGFKVSALIGKDTEQPHGVARQPPLTGYPRSVPDTRVTQLLSPPTSFAPRPPRPVPPRPQCPRVVADFVSWGAAAPLPAPPPSPTPGHFLGCTLKNYTKTKGAKTTVLHHFRKEPNGLECASSTFASLDEGRLCIHKASCLSGWWSPCRPINAEKRGIRLPKHPISQGAQIPHECIVVYCPSEEGCRHSAKDRCNQGHRNILTQIIPHDTPNRNRAAPRPLLNVLVMLIDSIAWNMYLVNMREINSKVQQLAGRGYHAYNFCHSRSVGHNSAPCQVPMMTGLNHDVIRSPAKYTRARDLIFADAHRLGYVTGLHYGAVWFEMFPAMNLTRHPVPEIDHWNWDFLTEETMTPAGNTFQADRYGCVGDRLTPDFIPTFVEGMYKAYPDERKLVWAFDELPHQNKRDMGPRVTPAVTRTLDWLEAEGHLNDTAVLLLSDHGLGMGHWSETKLGRRERWNPFKVIITPPWFQKAFPDMARALQENQHHITSSYDVYHTVKHFLMLPHAPPPKTHGNTLLSPLPPKRTCQQMGLLGNSCPHLEESDVPIATLPKGELTAFTRLVRQGIDTVNAYIKE